MKIDPENPSTVPEKYRARMLATADRMSNQDHDGVLQMLTDLLALAHNDGCVAAAWAFEQLTSPERER